MGAAGWWWGAPGCCGKVGLGLLAFGALGWQGVLCCGHVCGHVWVCAGMCVMCVLPHEWAEDVDKLPRVGIATQAVPFWCWPSWGLYAACMGPMYGVHEVVLMRLHCPAANCSCQCGRTTES